MKLCLLWEKSTHTRSYCVAILVVSNNKKKTLIVSLNHFNPVLPNDNYSYCIIKISFSKKDGIKKKISYEHRVYESVDDESLS